MNEILKYLQDAQIEARFISDSIRGERFEFKIYDCEIRIAFKEGMTLTFFKKEANSQYLEHLKRQAKFYKSMADGYDEQVASYKPVLN